MAEIPKEHDALRVAIDLPDGFDRHLHRSKIETIGHQWPHTVTFREVIEECTCGMYAFDLCGDSTYRAIAEAFPAIFAGRNFFEWLLAYHLEEIEQPEVGCLALYFSGNVWTHVGIVVAHNRVLSKWGLFPIYEHAVYEVPKRYGDHVAFYRMPGQKPIALFIDYAKACGLSENDIASAIARK